jgi:ATP-dependent DNA helicase RecQ
MDKDIHEILKQYWGYDQFRPLQESIIRSVLAQQDTLALLPTGGGKSICFQVPALAREGCAIIISPLIALMSDQVENLKKAGIPAIALNSSLNASQRELALHNASNGYYKFIYLSPESLQSEKLLNRLSFLNVNFIVVDEAHCISQWGYDFRPPYLEIHKLRNIFPDCPMMALTATATEKVVQDIQDRLHFKDEAQVFRKSFARPELAYNVLKTEDKWGQCKSLLDKVPGTALIYLRNRKGTMEVAQWLKHMGYQADFYHAGLSVAQRQVKQKAWIENECRIMVCTNAFGMGIDKPDVRLVIHLDLPDSLEAYFQEAGRAARDGAKAWSFVLVGPSDVAQLKQKFLASFPKREDIVRVYRALLNHLQIGIGSAEGSQYDFDLSVFCQQYRLGPQQVIQALEILNKEAILEFNVQGRYHSLLHLKADRRTLYDYQLRNPAMDRILKVLLRSYGGLDLDYSRIDENLIARRINSSTYKIKKALKEMQGHSLVDYLEAGETGSIALLQDRQHFKELNLSEEFIEKRKAELLARIQAVIDFVMKDETCRLKTLLAYFGEKITEDCGTCDVCRRKRSQGKPSNCSGTMEKALRKQAYKYEDLIALCPNQAQAKEQIRQWLATEKIRIEGELIFMNF